MSVDVNNLGTYLAKLSPTQLGAYAELHKNNPYIVSMVLDESNRRKAANNAQKAQQGQVPQPKVVDKVIASIAAPMPEDQGIAQLPAGEMNFADGGIVAFAGDGPSQLVQDISSWPARWDAWKRQLAEQDRAAAEQEKARLARQQARDEAGMKQGVLNYMFGTPEAAAQGKADTAAMQMQALTQQAADRTGSTFTPGGESGLRPVVPGQEQAQEEPAAKGKAAPTAGIGAPRAGGFNDYAAAKAGLADLYKTPDTSEYASARMAQAGAGVGIAQEAADRTKDFYDKLGEFGLKQEERLKEREGKLDKDTAQNKGLAILEAGLAMMSGTSANAFENIGKGAMSGVANYKKGLAALNERKDRLDDAYNQLETARYSDKKDRFQQIEAAQKNVDAAKLGIYQATTDIAAKRTDLDSKQATALADATVKSVEAQRDRQSREAAARLTYQTPERMAYEGILASTVTKDKPQGDPAKAYEILQASKREPMSRDTALKTWSGDMLLQQKYPNFEDYYKIAQGPSAAQFNPADQALIDKYSSKK